MPIGWHLGGMIKKRRIGGGVLRPMLADGSISPVSATTVVYCFRDSSKVIVIISRAACRSWLAENCLQFSGFLPRLTGGEYVSEVQL